MVRCSPAAVVLFGIVVTISYALPIAIRHAGEDHSADAPSTSAPATGAVAPAATTMPATTAGTAQMPMTSANAPDSTSSPSNPSSGAAPAATGGGAAESGSSSADPSTPASSANPTTSPPSSSSSATKSGAAAAGSSSAASTTNATTPGAKANTTAGTVASPSSSPATSNSGSCFPADAQVTILGGATKRMDELVPGDRVSVGRGQYSEVFMFTHKSADIAADFVVIDAAASGARLRVTPGHYLYVNGGLRAASAVVAGDVIELADGRADTVAAVSSAVLQGLYNPQTLQGDIVVDGVRASTYTTAVAPVLAHAMLTPLRTAYRVLRLSTGGFADGSKMSTYLPSGPAIC